MDGRQSEGFVRFRSGYADADLGRIKAQKQWMSAFMDELLQPKNLTKVPELVGIVFNNIETDLTNDELLYLALQGASIGLGDATFFTIPGEEKGANFGAYKEETVTMVNQHFNVYTEDVPASKFNIQEFKRKYENCLLYTSKPGLILSNKH